MTQVVGEHEPAIIVTDASVLINFLRIDRTDLLAGHSHAFLATDHVAAEITDRYPDQQQRFAAALVAGESSAIALVSERAKVADFYAARSRIIPPLPWTSFAPPFSPDHLSGSTT